MESYSLKIEKKPLLKAKILTVLLKIADAKGDINYNSDEAQLLWDIKDFDEDRLWELNQSGAIYFEQIGEDGFRPITMCSIKPETYDHLLNALAQVTNDQNLLNKRVTTLLNHDPNKLMEEIVKTQNHIQEAKEKIQKNELLKPLEKPLIDIEEHFNSISKVAENYDDVYKNILRPVQEEGKSGVKATVRWAIISIVASWILSNYQDLKEIVIGIIS